MDYMEKKSLYDRLCRALADYQEPEAGEREYEMTDEDWLYEFFWVMHDICTNWNELGFEGY